MKELKPIFIVLFVALVIGFFAQVKYIDTLKKEQKQVSGYLQIASDTLKYYRDKSKIEHARAESQIIDAKAVELIYQDTLDKLGKLYGVSKKDVQGWSNMALFYKGKFETELHNTKIIQIHDTINGRDTIIASNALEASYHDSTIAANIWLNGNDITVDWTVVDSIELVQYSKKMHWYGGKKFYIDGHAHNKSCHINGLQNVEIQGKEPSRIGVSVFGGLDINLKPTIGVGLSYSIIRF
mgnify:CR=1 FL=1